MRWIAAQMYRLVHMTAVVLQLLWYYIIRPLAKSPKTHPWFGANRAHFKREQDSQRHSPEIKQQQKVTGSPTQLVVTLL